MRPVLDCGEFVVDGWGLEEKWMWMWRKGLYLHKDVVLNISSEYLGYAS